MNVWIILQNCYFYNELGLTLTIQEKDAERMKGKIRIEFQLPSI